MSPSTFSFFALAAVASTAIYAFFTGKNKDDDEEQQSPPHTFTSSDHGHHYSSRSATTHTVNSHSTPSASTHAQPSYQQPWIEPRTAQATANTKENLGSSHHVHRHGLASSSRTVPTSTAKAQIPHPTQSTPSRVRQTTSTTSDHLDPLHRTSLTSSDTWDSRLTPSTSTSTLTHTSYTAQQTSTRGAQTTARTPTRTDYDNSLHRSDFAPSSSVWESYQTPSTPARTHASYLAQQTSARVNQATSRTPTSTDYDSNLHRSDFASPSVWESRQTTPTRTHASYPAQLTSARLNQTTTSTPTRTDYDSDLHRSDFASPSVWESRQTPTTPTRTHALYSTLQTSTGVVGTTVRTPTMADYDDMGPSPYSYLRTPSPDTSRPRVSRLTVSPRKHSRTQSSSSDSDYLDPSSRTRAVPRSRSHEVHDAIADAKDRKKALEMRDQAKRSARDMLDARDRARIAHRRGDHEAEDEYGQEARAHESAKKHSDKRAAKIFFRVNNKVRSNHWQSVGTGGVLTS
jgi:hypothetical protein